MIFPFFLSICMRILVAFRVLYSPHLPHSPPPASERGILVYAVEITSSHVRLTLWTLKCLAGKTLA